MRELPPRARAYVVAVVLVAAVVLTVSVRTVSAGSADATDIVFLAFLFGIASVYSTAIGGNISVSVAFIVGLASIVVLGPAGAAVVAVAGMFIRGRNGWPSPTKCVFNGASFVLSARLAGEVYRLLGGKTAPTASDDVLPIILAMSGAAVAWFLLNNLLIAGAVSTSTKMSLGRVWRGSFSWLAGGYLGYGLLGIVMARMYLAMGPFAAVFFLVPLLVARSAFANYTQLREAYDSTVRAFAQAVETKDYYTRGHSERVARVTELIAREWGMREDRVQVIRIAGMLHDVGKLGVPTRVLQKQGKLNQLEFEAIKLHPLRGYEMLCEIDFLREALDGVYHHHERMDGRGYPMGLTDAEIPEFARIIMVADAFDSMTSTRSYRQAKPVADAVAELRRCQGIQFDPKVVDCLVSGIERHGWEPHPEDFSGEQVTREGLPIERAAAMVDD